MRGLKAVSLAVAAVAAIVAALPPLWLTLNGQYSSATGVLDYYKQNAAGAPAAAMHAAVG